MNANTTKTSDLRFPRGPQSARFRPLSDDELLRVHQAVVEILSEVGFEVHSEKAMELFSKSDATIDSERGVVRVPESMIFELLDRAPAEITLYGREDRHNLSLGTDAVYLGTGGTALNLYDVPSGECRPASLGDLIDIIRLVDKLDNVHFIVLPTYPNELPLEQVDVNRFFAGMNHTTKHVMGGVYTTEGIRDVVRMAEQVAGSPQALRERPFISMITCGISPLKLDEKYGDFMLQVVEAGLPVSVPSEPLCGATSPITLAGNLVIQVCDALIMIMAAQLAKPGAPVISGCVAASTDLRDLAYLGGSVESGLINAAAAQMAHAYRLPYYGTAGISDSKTIDAQCGYEAAVNNLLVALAGGDFIHDAAGLMEFAMSVCKEKYVVDDEIIGMAMRAVDGIKVDDEHLAVDVIKKVGPAGHFIANRHTRRHMRKEHFQPRLSDRDKREQWQAGGAKTALDRASGIVDSILGQDAQGLLGAELRRDLMAKFPDVAREQDI